MSHNQPEVQNPAAVEMHVTNDAAYCAAQYGAGFEETLNAVHNEIRWAMDRDAALIEQYDIVNVSPR